MKPTLIWLTLFTRVMVGLLFGMAGYYKVFVQGPAAHAQQWFVGPYADSWIPHWLLYATGFAVPFVELIAGWLLVAGLLRLPSALALGAVLLLVTYGHALKEPLFNVNSHIIPRALLLIPTWMFPVDADPWSIDGLLARRKRG
ncbi:MAG: DoxX family membrane protein [Bryobacteraceae bacterium]